MAMQTMELEPDAFWRMVTQENLKVDGPSAGYMWAGKQGKTGWETYKTRAQPIGWLAQQRRVVTQNAVGGGALRVRVSVPSGTIGRLINLYVKGTASAGSTLIIYKFDEDLAQMALWYTIGAGANRQANLPLSMATIGDNGASSSVGAIIGPGEYIVADASAALQTETLTIGLDMIMSTETNPVIDTTGSAGTPALGANTISAANALQAVYL